MDEMQKIQYAANSYYNRGLEMAKERNLSGAARFLKRALQFNKYHTDARNLLGLIFYEMGETSDALIQWVISINLQPDGNRADYYLDEVQRKPGQLEIASQMVKKFNQALFYAQNDSDDLAVLQLKRIVDEKPNFVKAHLLLALLYMEHGDCKKIVVKHYGIFVDLTVGILKISGDMNVLQYLYQSGVGSHHASGFGALNVVRQGEYE